MPPQIFRNAWPDVALEDLRAFLSGAGDEGLTWEAKAGTVTPRMVAEAVCGLANSLGGFLILGATGGKGKPWTLPGVTLPDAEPTAWVSRVVRDRLRPVPSVDSKSWELDGPGSSIVIIAVESSAVPPCLTSDGLAFERVTSETVKITNPVVLASLIERGRAARADAEAKADHVVTPARHLLGLGGHEARTVTRCAIGLATVAYPPDIGSRLFSRGFVEAIEKVVADVLAKEFTPHSGTASGQLFHTHATLRYEVNLPGPSMPADHRVQILAAWDGSVGVTWQTTTREIDINVFTPQVLRWLVEAARRLVVELGGYGDARLAVRSMAADPGQRVGCLVTMHEPLKRVFPLDDPSAFDDASVRRELNRASGLVDYEPEP